MSDLSVQRLRRLLLLIPVVARAARSGRGLPLARAAEACGARSEAQLRDDIASVQNLWVDPSGAEEAIDLYVEDGEVQVTYANQFGTPPAFSLAEGAVLLAALAPFEKDGSRPVKEAIRKLRRAVPEVLRGEADRLAKGLDLGGKPPEPWAPSLQQAIAQRLETTLEYRAVADAEITRRVVEPRLLFQRDGLWYLAAWNVEKKAEHLYRLDRVVSVELGTRLFGAHQGPPVARYLEKGLYFASGAEVEVTLRFTGLSAALARSRYPARAEAGPEGAVSVKSRVTPGNYLVGQVLGYGGEATIAGPKEAVELLAKQARALLEIYAARAWPPAPSVRLAPGSAASLLDAERGDT
jgi:proteasome accessory factor C